MLNTHRQHITRSWYLIFEKLSGFTTSIIFFFLETVLSEEIRPIIDAWGGQWSDLKSRGCFKFSLISRDPPLQIPLFFQYWKSEAWSHFHWSLEDWRFSNRHEKLLRARSICPRVRGLIYLESKTHAVVPIGSKNYIEHICAFLFCTMKNRWKRALPCGIFDPIPTYIVKKFGFFHIDRNTLCRNSLDIGKMSGCLCVLWSGCLSCFTIQ